MATKNAKKKTTKRATPTTPGKPAKKQSTAKPSRSGVGAHGSRGRPKTGEGGGKWPGGGKKGEDE